MDHRSYVIILIAVTFFTPFSNVTLNLIVDPYDFRGMLGITAINPERILFHGEQGPCISDWQGNSYNVRWYRPDAAVFGSSCVEALMANRSDLQSCFGNRIFHYSAAGVSMGRMEYYFRHTATLFPLKNALFELQFYMFNIENQQFDPASRAFLNETPWAHQPNYDRNFLLKVFNISLTASCTQESFTRLKFFLLQVPKQYLVRWGIIKNEPLPPSTPETFTVKEFRKRWLGVDRNIFIGLFGLKPSSEFMLENENGERPFDYLRNIIALARQKGIPIRFFIPANHARMFEMIRLNGWWPVFERWKQELVTILAEDAAAHPGQPPIPLWDFSGYNNITTESFPTEETDRLSLRWYSDSVHFTWEAADLQVDRILNVRRPDGPIPPEFGVLLTRENIDGHQRSIRASQTDYGRNHAAEIEEIKTMLDAMEHAWGK